MKYMQSIGIALMLVIASHAWGADGLISLKSPHSPKAAMICISFDSCAIGIDKFKSSGTAGLGVR